MEQPEEAPDLVGRTSARLLAAGVDRRDRLDALQLLAILDASIDLSGRVRRPLDDLAAEFELEPMSVMRSLDHLERAGAVQRDGAGVVLLGGDGVGGMQLAHFLDDVRASFDGDVHERRGSTLLARTGAALAAAAAAIAVLTLASAGGPQQPVALLDAGTTTTADLPGDPRSEPTAPLGTSARPAPSVAESAPTAPLVETPVAAAQAPCPTGSPVADLVDGLVEIANPTGESVVIETIAIGTATVRQTIHVDAGETVTRDLSPTSLPVEVEIVDWRWSDASVARNCPS